MKVIITGGGGFIGQCLAKEILQRGSLRAGNNNDSSRNQPVTTLILADVVQPKELLFDANNNHPAINVQFKVGDVSSVEFCESLVHGDDRDDNNDALSVFHLGAVMSGTGEQDFDLCMRVNLQGTLNMLETVRKWHDKRPSGGNRPTFVFTSAGATIGSGHVADWVSKDDFISDATRAAPHTTYGCTKACCELLLADYSRRHFLDGRGVRLPTVLVRAGSPNAATTSCFSSVIREPLNGQDAILPLGPNVLHAATGYRAAVTGILAVHDAPPDKIDNLLGFDRTVFLPSRALSLSQLERAMHGVVAPESHAQLGKVIYEEDTFMSSVVGSFPTRIDSSRALELGAPPTPDLETLVREYCEDFPSAVVVKIAPPTVKESMQVVDADAVALITGAGSGIGRAVAVRLSQGGWGGYIGKGTKQDGKRCNYGIVLAGRRQAALEETRDMCLSAASEAGVMLDALVVPADVTRDREVTSLLSSLKERFGRIDLLFNNAGINIPPASVEEVCTDDWRRIIDTNLTGCWLVAKAAIKLMAQQNPRGGRIINNGSISAESPRPGSAPYTASKHAVLGLTKSIALDGRKFNVACGQIDFGNVTSDLTAKMSTGMPQANGSVMPEPTFSVENAAETVHTMAALPLDANVLSMTVMATKMPYVGRG